MNTSNLFLKYAIGLRVFQLFYKAPDPNLSDSNRNALGYLPAARSFLQSYFKEETGICQIKPTENSLYEPIQGIRQPGLIIIIALCLFSFGLHHPDVLPIFEQRKEYDMNLEPQDI